MKEELNLTEDDLDGMRMRYIALRNTKGEIRQNYYFFADLKPEHYSLFTSNEGKCRWVDYADIMNYDMPLTARYVMDHYLRVGKYTDDLYGGVYDGTDYHFTEIRES